MSGSSSGSSLDSRDPTGELVGESKTKSGGGTRDTSDTRNELDQLLDDVLDMAKDMILKTASDMLFGSDSKKQVKVVRVL